MLSVLASISDNLICQFNLDDDYVDNDDEYTAADEKKDEAEPSETGKFR